MTPLRFKQLDPRAVLPARGHDSDAGLDLSCIEPFELAPGERASIRTGLGVEIPDGFGGLILPRSGLARRHGIALVNAPGLIDAGYRGELEVLLINTDTASRFTAEAGDRIAQLMIVAFYPGVAQWTEELSTSSRGEGGFGSTGTSHRAHG
jgi:dUTP pyrophosphatase